MFILAGRREDRRHKMRYPQLPLKVSRGVRRYDHRRSQLTSAKCVTSSN